MNTENAGHFDVVWPRGERWVKAMPVAPPPASLNGKRVGLLWDYLFRGDEVFGHLREAIAAKYPDATFVHWEEFGNTHGPNEREVVAALPRRLKELRVDAVISGMGC